MNFSWATMTTIIWWISNLAVYSTDQDWNQQYHGIFFLFWYLLAPHLAICSNDLQIKITHLKVFVDRYSSSKRLSCSTRSSVAQNGVNSNIYLFVKDIFETSSYWCPPLLWNSYSLFSWNSSGSFIWVVLKLFLWLRAAHHTSHADLKDGATLCYYEIMCRKIKLHQPPPPLINDRSPIPIVYLIIKFLYCILLQFWGAS